MQCQSYWWWPSLSQYSLSHLVPHSVHLWLPQPPCSPLCTCSPCANISSLAGAGAGALFSPLQRGDVMLFQFPREAAEYKAKPQVARGKEVRVAEGMKGMCREGTSAREGSRKGSVPASMLSLPQTSGSEMPSLRSVLSLAGTGMPSCQCPGQSWLCPALTLLLCLL